jgi:hypothetical protein
MNDLREAVVALRDNWKADPLVSKFYVRELSALLKAYPKKPVVRREVHSEGVGV